MIESNDYSPLGFLAHHIYWGALLTWCYRVTIFRIQPPYFDAYSVAWLYILVVLCLLFGYLVTLPRNRSTLNLIVTVLMPFELHTMFMLWQDRSTLILISAAVAFLLAAVLFLRNLLRPIRRPERSREIIKRRIKGGLINSRLIIGLCLIPVLFSAVGIYKNMIDPPDTTLPPAVLSEEDIALETSSLIESFQEEYWAQLSADERLQLVCRLVELERQCLGIPYHLNVAAVSMPVTKHGEYSCSDSTYSITINTKLLSNNSSKDVVTTTLHECYHAYQHALIDLYLSSDARYQDLQLFSQIKVYADEFMSYKKPGQSKEDFYEYYTQKVEKEARKYAEENINRYFPRNSSSGSGS